ncbi:hypothetical protein, partial [Mesorhizobium sp. M8A.F.Ca.ET.213.01.1.1]|uniref:hypothetical protein n=1 Tax=Mesorhizobium sp. M8A.F.Ca.ET.213.01.1.1 TaxID=2563970 RepID=UPI001AEE437B
HTAAHGNALPGVPERLAQPVPPMTPAIAKTLIGLSAASLRFGPATAESLQTPMTESVRAKKESTKSSIR